MQSTEMFEQSFNRFDLTEKLTFVDWVQYFDFIKLWKTSLNRDHLSVWDARQYSFVFKIPCNVLWYVSDWVVCSFVWLWWDLLYSYLIEIRCNVVLFVNDEIQTSLGCLIYIVISFLFNMWCNVLLFGWYKM